MNHVDAWWVCYLRQRELAKVRCQRGADLVDGWLRAWTRPQWALLALLAVGLALRLWGLQRPPLEFHPQRQFMGATIARSYFLESRAGEPAWRRQVADLNRRNENALEPHILEHAAVLAYRLLGREVIWIPRGLSVCFWMAGAVLLYRIGVRLASPASALLSVAIFLLMPFGILASRSFQPDPLMVCLQLAGIMGLLRFAEREGLQRLLLAAGLCAAAVFVKPVCVFVLLGVYGIGSLRRQGLRRTLTSRYTILLGAALCLPVAYYLSKMLFDTVGSDLRGQAEGSIVPALLLTRVFWNGVALMLMRVVGIMPLLLAVAGLALVPEKAPHQGVLAGMWAGYAVFVLIFTFHTHTHDYYHLQILPIAALSLGPLALVVVGHERRFAWLMPARVLMAAVIVAVAMCLAAAALASLGPEPLTARRLAKSAVKVCGATWGVPQKFMGYLRPASIGVSSDVADARAVGECVGHSANTIFLGKDLGSALAYLGELSGVRWPSCDLVRAWRLRGDDQALVTAEQRLDGMLRQNPNADYFVVTDFGDLAQQPDLERLLSAYPVVARTTRYAVYSLKR
jgi:hypothetical protein